MTSRVALLIHLPVLPRVLMLALLLAPLAGCNLIRLHQNQMEATAINLGFTQQTLALRDGGTLNYWIGGSGEPLLLIQGFGGDALSNWRELLKPLSRRYRVIAPDLLGFGASMTPSTPTLDLQAQAMLALLDALAIPRVHLVGVSYGGFVGYALLREPERVSTLTLIASPGPQFSDEDIAALEQRLAVPSVETMFVPDDPQQLQRLFEASFIKVPALTGLVIGDIYRVYFQANREQKRQFLRQLPQARDEMLALPLNNLPPSLVLWGEADEIFLLGDGVEVSRALSAPLVVIPDAGHAVPIEQPGQVSRLLIWFIERQASAI